MTDEYRPCLSICIATYNRAAFIGNTLESIIAQLAPGIEVVIVSGNSPDGTDEVVQQYLTKHEQIRYFREPINSGVDRDYDKAVGYANGDYCWLMTDDDLVAPGAISRLLACLSQGFDLIVANSEVRNANFSAQIRSRLLALGSDKAYGAGDEDRFFSDVGAYLSFIGAVVIKRSVWLARDRRAFFGTLFIHFGVIFQAPALSNALVLAEPLVVIRYGNAMWAARAFEIWMFKWPGLVWSFSGLSDHAKAAVSPPEPWRRWRKLGIYRAIGSYSLADYRKFLRPRLSGLSRLVPFLIAICPPSLANVMASIYCALLNRDPINAFDLSRARHSTWVSRMLAGKQGV